MTKRLSLAWKFFLTQLAIGGIALLVAGGIGYFSVRSLILTDTDETLFIKASLVAETFRPLLAARPLELDAIAKEGDLIGKVSGTRLTVVLPDGTVVADSTVGAAGLTGMENHESHPEIREALSGVPGFSRRRSITVREEMRYAALPIEDEGTVIGAARTALPVSMLDTRLRQITAIIWGTGLAALLLILAGAAWLARRITGPLAEMKAAAREMGAGNLSRTVQIRTGDEVEDMADAMNRMAAQLSKTIGQLDAEKARLMTLLANLSDGVIVIAPDRTVRMMNHAAGAILNASETMVEGRPYPEAIRLPQVLPFIDGWMKEEAPKPRDVSLPMRGGDRTVRISGNMVRYRGVAGADVLITLRDITEERRLSQIKSDFVSNASHELRTPLTNIRGYLEAFQDALRQGETPDPAFLETVHANALRMERLIDDLLDLSKAETGTMAVEKEKTSIASFLSRIAELHGPPAERAGKTLTMHAADGTFVADLRMLSLALGNLVDNAIKYGKEGGRIEVSGKVDGETCVLEVADDGPGIPAEHLPRLFERFYRVDKGRSRELGGTGLGLSIARHVAESHGGSIHVESRLGEGTRFTVRLPATPA
jgi:two-component system phosphate regulon sensor histidine kinase PhoR